MKIAILLATYNGEKYIEELLQSLMEQTRQDFVCYIHDDGSTDKTVDICKRYIEKYPEQFVLWEYAPQGGAKKNFFSMLERVDADYIFFCDQDDYWEKTKIEKTMCCGETMSQKPLLVYTDLEVVNEKLETQAASFYALTHFDPNQLDVKNAMVKGYIPGCTIMINRALCRILLQYKDIDALKMHDWWAVIVVLAVGGDIKFVNESLIKYRQHSDNTIGVKDTSTLDRIKFNIKRVFSGTLAQEKKKNIMSPRIQVKELSYVKECLPENLKVALEYANLEKKNKVARMIFYLKNFKHVYRLWWMLFWV